MSKRVQPKNRAAAIPLWIVASIGRSVALKSDFQEYGVLYPAGRQGRLTSVMARPDGSLYATVAIDPADPDYWENFEFDQLRPVAAEVEFDLDIERGYILF